MPLRGQCGHGKQLPGCPGKGDTNFNTHVVEAGLSYLLQKGLIYTRTIAFMPWIRTAASYTVGSPDISPTSYNLIANTGTLQLEYVPYDNLTLRGGYRLQYQHTYGDTYADNPYNAGGMSPAIPTGQWMGGVCGLEACKVVKIFGEYQGRTSATPTPGSLMRIRMLRELRSSTTPHSEPEPEGGL